MPRSILYSLLAWMLAACVGAAPPAAEQPPNFIFILADDLGYGELGTYGQQHIRTPHLDQLAADGMRFTQHYSGSPVCAPSRATLLTGLHTGHAQVRDNFELGGFRDDEERGQLPLAPGTFTLARMLQDHGYATGAMGKWGLGGPGSTGVPHEQGFDLFYGYLDQKQAHNYYPTHLWRNAAWDSLANTYFHPHQRLDAPPADPRGYDAFKGTDYAPALIHDEALAFIREHQAEPFFLYVPSIIPHLALQVPDEELDAYDFDEEPYLGDHMYLPHERPQSAYAAMITYLDRQVGEIRALVEELGLAENTYIVFTSYNGPTYVGGVDTAFFDSNGPLRGEKGAVYEGGIRVPTIAWAPGRIPAGTTTDHVSAFWDWLPTFADLAGTAPPDTLALDGLSIVPTLHQSGNQSQHEALYWEFHGRNWGGAQAVRLGDWKAVRHGGRDNADAPIQLYNLATDLAEANDVAADHPDVIARVEAVLAARTPSPIERWRFAARE